MLTLTRRLGFIAIAAYFATPLLAGSFRSSDFDLNVTWDDDKLYLSCSSQCAWSSLSFSYTPFVPVLFDNHGMVSSDRERSENSDLDPFLLSVMRDGKGVSFEGLEGTHFRKLGFSCGSSPCDRRIGPQGMR